MNQAAISAKGLCRSFAGKEVLRDCTLSVPRGCVYGLLGRNGAGKTTLLKLLAGLLRPTAGTAGILGLDSIRDREAMLRRVGCLIETPVFYEHLSAEENLRLHLACMGMEERDPGPELALVGLPAPGGGPVSAFSLGMRQRLAVARAILHRPEVFLLDEPMNGLDPVGMRELGAQLRRLSEEWGVTVLLSSHLLSELTRTAHGVGVLEGGRIVRETDTAGLSAGGLEEYFLSALKGGISDGNG